MDGIRRSGVQVMRLTSRHAWVEIAAVRAPEDEVVVRFRITSSSGFRAELPACCADACLSGQREACLTPVGGRHMHSVGGKTSVNAWLAHIQTHCHGWHPPIVERLAKQVLKTYRGRTPTRI